MIAEIDLSLAPEPEVVATARHALDRLVDLLPREKLEDVRLVVSELVANSVRHGDLSLNDQILLSVIVSGGSVRGRVCDPGPGFEKPSQPHPRPDLSGGWGAAYRREDLRSLGSEAKQSLVRLVRDRLRKRPHLR